MAELGLIIKVGLDKKSLKKSTASIGKFLKTGLKAGAVGAAGALAAVGVAAGAAAAEALAFADEANTAMEQFRRETGLAEESVEAFSGSAKNLFAAGVGEGIDDIAQAMATVNNTMQTGAKETENITKRALVMRDVFDKDVAESVDAVKVLMDEFGLTSEEAFDFLVTGAQKGLDRNGDLLDSVREYGNLFSNAGATADEFFSVLETGAAGGVLGTDKVADAFKEFQIRFIEGNKDLTEGLTTLGLNYDELRAGVEDGSISISDAFNIVTKAAGEVDASLLTNQEAVAKLGAQFEDLGIEAVAGIDAGATSLQDMAGSMDEVVTKNTSIAESMGNLRRQMVVALEPAAQELMPLLADGVAKVSEFLIAARPIFQGFAADLSQTLGPAIQIIGDSLARISAVFGIVSEDASGMDAALKILEGTLDLIVTAIEAVAVASKLLADAFEIGKALGQQIGEIGGLLFGGDENGGGEGGGLGALLGFQKGGSFTVGGSGGSDSQTVAFRATPANRVSVTPPGQGGGLTININSPVFGVDDLDAKLNVWGQGIIDATAGAMN